MSHIESVSPPGPLTLAAGESADIDVLVSGVPGDDQSTFSAQGSDGSTLTVSITTDRAVLEGILSGVPQPHQVLGEVVSGPGTLESVGPVTGGWRFRFVAA